MVSEREFLGRAQALVRRAGKLRVSDALPKGLESDLKELKRTNVALIESKIADIDSAIGLLDDELKGGRVGKDRHRMLYGDLAGQKSDLESDLSMLALCNMREYVQFLMDRLDESRYGAYDTRPKVDSRKIKAALGLEKAADDGMLMWAWACMLLGVGGTVIFGILSGSWSRAFSVFVVSAATIAVASVIAYVAARFLGAGKVTLGKSVVYAMSVFLISGLSWLLFYSLILFGFNISGFGQLESFTDLAALERSVSAEKVLLHSVCVVVNFAVSVACARRVFDCDFEKAVTMVVLGYVIGIGIWIIIGVWVLEHLIL